MASPQSSQSQTSNSGFDSVTPGHQDMSSSDAEVELGPAELIARHQNGIWRYLRMLGCDSSTADDLTQETFLRVLRRDNFVQHSDAATSSYLRRTAYNLLVSMHRKQRKALSSNVHGKEYADSFSLRIEQCGSLCASWAYF